ncbi:MAG TPA: phosphodiesterase [Xanthobacteraceae bacterium]|nr:phosphodiesterase [Xanthobacteraceae bacterium]
MLICQISDLHVRPRGLAAYRVVETNMLTERALDMVAALRPRPDVVLITGDLTDCGLTEEYELLKKLLKRLPMPVYLVPGNHDRRDTLKAVFADWPSVVADPDFVQCVVDDFPVRLIGLDTLTPGSGAGALCEKRLAFLERALAADRVKPVVIFMHHPPFRTGIRHMDDINLIEGAERLAALVREHGKVERILLGHDHRAIDTLFAGTLASVAPAVAHQVAFDLDPAHEGALLFEPPAIRLHLYTPQGGIVSHTVYVERFAGPFPFVLDPAYPGRH